MASASSTRVPIRFVPSPIWARCYPIGPQDGHEVLLEPHDRADESDEARVAVARLGLELEEAQHEVR